MLEYRKPLAPVGPTGDPAGSVGSPPLIGVIWAAANGGRHKAMRPGRWVAEWHMLPSQTHCTHACSPGWAVVALGLATPQPEPVWPERLDIRAKLNALDIGKIPH